MTCGKSPAGAIAALLALAAAIGAGCACFAAGGAAPLSHERLIELRALMETATAGGGEEALEDEALEDEAHSGSLIAEGKVPASLFREAEQVLALLPDGLMGEFRARGWAIVLTSTRDLSAYVPGGGRIVGATVFDEKRIYVEADVAVVAESLLHEMGHFADMSLGRGGVSRGLRRRARRLRRGGRALGGEREGGVCRRVQRHLPREGLPREARAAHVRGGAGGNEPSSRLAGKPSGRQKRL